MDWNTFLTQTLENVVATIPAIAVVTSPIVYGLKKIKDTTSKFPTSVEDTKAQLTEKFNASADNIKNILEEKQAELQEKVNGSLVGMKEQLATYQAELQATKDQANILVKQNKLYMETIADTLGKDAQYIQNGIATKVNAKVNSLKEELFTNPEKLLGDSKAVEKILIDAKSVLGEEAYQRLLDKVNAKKV